MTKISDLPVLGHVPKKRVPDLTKTITLAQLYEILDSDWLAAIEDEDYKLQWIREQAKKVAVKARS